MKREDFAAQLSDHPPDLMGPAFAQNQRCLAGRDDLEFSRPGRAILAGQQQAFATALDRVRSEFSFELDPVTVRQLAAGTCQTMYEVTIRGQNQETRSRPIEAGSGDSTA